MGIRDFNLLDPQQVQDSNLFPTIAALHDSEPVFWSDQMHGWVLTSHEVVDAAFKDRRLSNSGIADFAFSAIPRSEWEMKIPNLYRAVENWIVNLDAPRHQRVRKLFLKAFSRNFVDSLRPIISRYCDEAVVKAVSTEKFDFMKEIVFPVPARIILNFLGLSEAYLDRVSDWNHRVNRTVQTIAPEEVLLDGDRAIAEMNDAIRVEIEKRRATPQDDFLTKLIEATEDGDSLSMDELFSACQVLLIAGQDTTVNSICLGTLAFLRHPDQLKLFLNGEIDPLTAMNEVTRYTSMSTCMRKTAAEEFELKGQLIRPGEFVYLLIAGGNRDPRVFKDPDVFDLGRDNLDKIVTFGPGLHLCIGHYLARLEMASFFEKFFGTVKSIEVLDDPVTFQPNFVFRGLPHLNMRVAA